MILKSMTRKAPTFGQLIDYIGRPVRGGADQIFARNLYHGGADHALVCRQFWQNFRALPKRKNGNALYHEVIVLDALPNVSNHQKNILLQNIAEHYCALRAPNQLAWGAVHFDTKYPHIHLMISSNAIGSSKRVRLDKSQFAHIQRVVEKFTHTQLKIHQPDITLTSVYDVGHQREGVRHSMAEGEQKRRTRKPTQKEAVRQRLMEILSGAHNEVDLMDRLKASGFELYRRGQTLGVRTDNGGRRYRLSTLGMEETFHEVVKQFPKSQTQASKEINLPANTSTDNSTITEQRTAALLQSRQQMADKAKQMLERFDEPRER